VPFHAATRANWLGGHHRLWPRRGSVRRLQFINQSAQCLARHDRPLLRHGTCAADVANGKWARSRKTRRRPGLHELTARLGESPRGREGQHLERPQFAGPAHCRPRALGGWRSRIDYCQTRGMPRPRSATILRWISLVPPAIVPENELRKSNIGLPNGSSASVANA
jgi:hypothetical protein